MAKREKRELAPRAGDTPMDLQASVEGGAQAVGVTTGVFTRADLEGCGAGARRSLPAAPPGCRDVLISVMADRPCITASVRLPSLRRGTLTETSIGTYGREACAGLEAACKQRGTQACLKVMLWRTRGACTHAG